MNILNATHLAMNRAITNIDSNIHYDLWMVIHLNRKFYKNHTIVS